MEELETQPEGVGPEEKEIENAEPPEQAVATDEPVESTEEPAEAVGDPGAPTEDSAGSVDEPAGMEESVVSIEEFLPEEQAGEEGDSTASLEEAQLRAVLEAIVYVADEPLTALQIAKALNQPQDRVKALLAQLVAEFDKPEHGVGIREVAGGYKMATKAEHHEAVRNFVKNIQPLLKLSLPALETLAVIAYKQPVTTPEILEIRGVQGGGVLKTLLDRKLITEAGRKNVIGKPIMYKTTKEFLIQFGLKDLAELPSLKEFEEIRRMAMPETDIVEQAELKLEPEGAAGTAVAAQAEPVPAGESAASVEGAESAAGEVAEPANTEAAADEVADPVSAGESAANVEGAESAAGQAAEPANTEAAAADEVAPAGDTQAEVTGADSQEAAGEATVSETAEPGTVEEAAVDTVADQESAGEAVEPVAAEEVASDAVSSEEPAAEASQKEPAAGNESHEETPQEPAKE
jgi:segregation and condensation protein B